MIKESLNNMTGGSQALNGSASTYRGVTRLFIQTKVTDMYSRLIFKRMQEIQETDKSFTEKPTFFDVLLGEHKIPRDEVREIYLRGIQTGLEEGVRMTRLEGQMIMLNESARTRLQDEFLQKFHELCAKYGFVIQFHPDHGLCVVAKNGRSMKEIIALEEAVAIKSAPTA
jgi:hypothetical protein